LNENWITKRDHRAGGSRGTDLLRHLRLADAELPICPLEIGEAGIARETFSCLLAAAVTGWKPSSKPLDEVAGR
ncbi:hypothetical protein AB9F44_34840, partial [Rhizobium leguminosarum]|uniref:hypothetical protein n=1 Tax=Rhizobium leguminosarum TaxID=384 RepID=UPI003F94C33F